MAFAPRTNESGIYGNSYWYNLTYNPGAKDYIWLPNCTTYAYGRSVEISGGQVTRTTIFGSHGFHNAANWYSEALWDKTTDKAQVTLGDILVWGEGGAVGSAGHVAVVERITDCLHERLPIRNTDKGQSRNKLQKVLLIWAC